MEDRGGGESFEWCHAAVREHLHPQRCSRWPQVCDSAPELLQAVDDGASFPAIVLLLPFVHLMNQLEEGALGDGRVPIHGPAQELELLHHAEAVLRLPEDKQLQSHVQPSSRPPTADRRTAADAPTLAVL